MTRHWPNWRLEVLRALDKGNLVIARDDGEAGELTAFCAFEVNRAGLLGPVAVRPELMGRGRGRGVLVGALHELRRRGGERVSVVLGRTGRPLRGGRRQSERRLLRLPQGAAVNLVPVPREVELTGAMRAAAPANHRIDPSLAPQGYLLSIDDSGVELAGADDAGLFYGEATLAQLLRLYDGSIPIGVIRDHPDFEVRGVMLDISRDKVPTTETLYALIERLAALKINQVQLYSEHTFAYRNHPEVHRAASPFTADEILELDAFCRARYVELVPNQNCLGHMNRWLVHDALPAARHRAERIHRPLRHLPRHR